MGCLFVLPLILWNWLVWKPIMFLLKGVFYLFGHIAKLIFGKAIAFSESKKHEDVSWNMEGLGLTLFFFLYSVFAIGFIGERYVLSTYTGWTAFWMGLFKFLFLIISFPAFLLPFKKAVFIEQMPMLRNDGFKITRKVMKNGEEKREVLFKLSDYTSIFGTVIPYLSTFFGFSYFLMFFLYPTYPKMSLAIIGIAFLGLLIFYALRLTGLTTSELFDMVKNGEDYENDEVDGELENFSYIEDEGLRDLTKRNWNVKTADVHVIETAPTKKLRSKSIMIPEKSRFQNMQILGPMGTGKTMIALNMAVQDLTKKAVGVIALEPTTDFLDKLAIVSTKIKRNFYFVNPVDPATDVLNPLEGDDWGSIIEMNVEVFYTYLGKEANQHHKQRQGGALRTAIRALKEVKGNDTTYQDVVDFIRPEKAGFRKKIIQTLQDNQLQIEVEIKNLIKDIKGEFTELTIPLYKEYRQTDNLNRKKEIEQLPEMSKIIELNDKLKNAKTRKLYNKLSLEFVPEYHSRFQGDERSTSDAIDGVSGLLDYLNQLTQNEVMRRVLCNKSTFSLKEVFDKGEVLLISTSYSKLGPDLSSVFGKLMTLQIKNQTFARDDYDEVTRDQLPLMAFYMDECHQYLFDKLKDIFSMARKYRIAMCILHQSLAQLRDVSEELEGVVYDNTRQKIIYGGTNIDTLAKIEEEVGKEYKIIKDKGRDFWNPFDIRESIKEDRRSIITKEEIFKLPAFRTQSGKPAMPFCKFVIDNEQEVFENDEGGLQSFFIGQVTPMFPFSFFEIEHKRNKELEDLLDENLLMIEKNKSNDKAEGNLKIDIKKEKVSNDVLEETSILNNNEIIEEDDIILEKVLNEDKKGNKKGKKSENNTNDNDKDNDFSYNEEEEVSKLDYLIENQEETYEHVQTDTTEEEGDFEIDSERVSTDTDDEEFQLESDIDELEDIEDLLLNDLEEVEIEYEENVQEEMDKGDAPKKEQGVDDSDSLLEELMESS